MDHILEIKCMVDKACQVLPWAKAANRNQIIQFLNCNSWWCFYSKIRTYQLMMAELCLPTLKRSHRTFNPRLNQPLFLDLVSCKQLKSWLSRINRPVGLNKFPCKRHNPRLSVENMMAVTCWTRACTEAMLDIWRLNSLLVLTRATNLVRMLINIIHFSNIKLTICRMHITQLWLELKFSNIWAWQQISNIKESNQEVSCSTTQVNSGSMGVAHHQINTLTITWREVKLLETKDLIGKASSRWMAMS